eukprot:188905_1
MGCAQSPAGQTDEGKERIQELEKQVKELTERLSKYEGDRTGSFEMTSEKHGKGGLAPETDGLLKNKHNDNEEKVNESTAPTDDLKRPSIKHPKKKETDEFWIDLDDEMKALDYLAIKRQIPNKDFIDEEDERWKMELWKKDYGEYDLVCTVALVSYNTDDWTDDDTNLMYASVSKYGINSWSAWDKIAEILNRETDDVLQKYSSLVGISVKQLKKTAAARG